MQVLGSRRGGIVVLVAGVIAVLAVLVLAVTQIAGRPGIAAASPAPGSSVPTARTLVTVSTEHVDRLKSLHVTLDGRDRTKDVRSSEGRLVLNAGRLVDGQHRVGVRFTTGRLIGGTVNTSWTFEVDTRRPPLAVAAPQPEQLSARRRVRFSGRSEPGATVTVAWTGGTASARAGDDGGWTADARLPEGPVTATVTAADRAGNATAARRRVVIDTTAPRLAVAPPAGGATLTETDQPLVYGSIKGEDPRGLTFGGRVNATRLPTVAGAVAEGPEGEGVEASAGGGLGRLVVDGQEFALAVGTLPQGVSTVTLWARDRAGNTTRRTVRLRVDSTEEFGAATLVRGARGEDVRELQRRLRQSRLLKARPTGTFDAPTSQAVRRYQRRHKLTATGVVGTGTLKKMIGRIVINLGERKLRLIRDGKVAREYKVAIGQPAYPTPIGNWTIVVKQKDPTWRPPDSPWAEGLGPIPPGPGNPLGTRWIGTSSPAIGIHGTYADYSIGTAASHGCIRMHIPDVEALYEEVTVGMEVDIRA